VQMECWQCELSTLQVVTSVGKDDLAETSECTVCGAENDLGDIA
jgi:hypothetical protein